MIESHGRGTGALKMVNESDYLDRILDLIESNGWSRELQLEILSDSPTVVRVRLGSDHRSSPGDLVNDYTDGVHPLEQVQQECLRALRTGRIGA